MTAPPVFGRWLLAAVATATLSTMVVAAAMEAPPGEANTVEIQAAAKPPARPIPTTTPPTTTIPDIEALIPLPADAIAETIGPSVGFVLSQQGTGSGVVISENLLVTNAHVAWPDRTVSLVFRNGATFQGRVIALDPFVDLAVVDISRLTRKPPPITIGSITDIEVGDELYVVGYPAPDEFTPEPTVDAGDLLGITDWEFTGVDWLTVGAPAIGGQSGGAIVDEYGRLVGISTFGSSSSLTSIAIDDVMSEVDRLLAASDLRGLEPRAIPHSGARRSNDLSLEGEWDQAMFFGWFREDAEVDIDWVGGSGSMAAAGIDGVEIATGSRGLEFSPWFAFPVVVTADADSPTSGALESSLPLIAYVDPDHGKTLPREGMIAGVYEVGGDRDFFYLELEEGERATVTIESAARTKLRIYGPDGGVVAKDVDLSGFIGSNASSFFTAAEAGRYVVAVESSLSTVAGYMVITR